MDLGHLVGGVLRSVLGGRGKKSKKALRYLTGGGASMLSHPTAMLTAAGLAWGIFETLKNQQGSGLGGVTAQPLPPVPAVAGSAPSANESAMRLVRLAISAARADGDMNEQERAAVGQQATAAGVASAVEAELEQRTPLTQIVAGVYDPAERATLYVLAFTILRADEQLNGAERIYLAQLANLLGLDPQTVQALEKDTGERIDALGDQGQPGG